MDVKNLNFFQQQYLTFFKDKRNKKKADIYHFIISFVMENNYPPDLYIINKEFPIAEKALLANLTGLIKMGLIAKDKYDTGFIFYPVLKPFVSAEELKYEIYTRFSGSKKYARGREIKNKLRDIIDGKFKEQRNDWSNSFKEEGYKDNKDYNPEKTADDYDREELPPNFDDTENTGGMVVV